MPSLFAALLASSSAAAAAAAAASAAAWPTPAFSWARLAAYQHLACMYPRQNPALPPTATSH